MENAMHTIVWTVCKVYKTTCYVYTESMQSPEITDEDAECSFTLYVKRD